MHQNTLGISLIINKKIYLLSIAETQKNLTLSAKCPTTLNIGFVIDASGSIASHYSDLLDVIVRLLDHFNISKEGSHVGAISFSDDSNIVIGFNEHYDVDSFKLAVRSLPLPNGQTRIDKAMRKVHEDLMKSDSASRPNVVTVLYILTDGLQTSSTVTLSLEKSIDQIISLGGEVSYIILAR